MYWTLISWMLLCGSISALASPLEGLAGLWDGTIRYDEYRIPFEFELAQKGREVVGSFLSGDERVTSTDGHLTDGALTLDFNHYATHLSATISGGAIKGTYGSSSKGLHEFEATRHKQGSATQEQAPDIAGVWVLPNESAKGEHAWQLIVRQQRNAVSAAILRVDGDTGELTGRYANGKFTLSHFDGARANILEITPKSDGTLAVALLAANATKNFTASRLEHAKLVGLPLPTDPDEHTSMKDPAEPLQFSFPDLSGKLVSNTDERFRDKVVIVTVSGSWCPNCHDEAPYLVDLYRRYHNRGLEIVALDFEEPEQQKDPERLRAFIRKYSIPYTYLLVGQPSELQAKVP